MGEQQLTDMTDAELIRMYADDDEKATHHGDCRDRIGFILQSRMEARGATAMPHPDYKVALKEGTPSWDHEVLFGLRELVDPEELAEGHTPEHEETIVVAASWNMTKVKKLLKYGGEIKATIDRARIPGRMRLVVKPRVFL